MFYSYNDILKLEKFNKDKPVTERDNAKHLLQEMAAYAESSVCRRRQLLHYFGEHMDKDCGFCDNCIKPKVTFEAQEQIVLAIRAVLQTDQRFGIQHLTDVLKGIENQYAVSYSHTKLDVFGQGAEYEASYWNSLYRQILVYEFLEKDIDNYGIVKVTEKGLNFVENPYPVTLSKDHDYSNATEEDDDDKETPATTSGKAHDQVLFDLLKALRKKIAKEKNLPPYVIFQDPSLEEMATTYPTTREELSQINGVGMGKVVKFGKPFIDLISKYVEENDIETASDVVVKSTVNKSKIKIFIIQQVDRKIDLEEIAESKDLEMAELLEEIEHICYSGTRLNLDYYIDQVMDDERQEEIYDYFMSAETDNIQVALSKLGKEYSEEELRLMRIKFISEVAN
jgi:ATP-dependent DNA helicase RecQ